MTTYLTTIPTLEQFDQHAAKKLKDICKDMEGLMTNTNSKISTLLQSQEKNFLKSYKIVVEKISADFKALQTKFEEYISYHEKETEVVNAQNKLVFFRNECQVLNKICTELANENKILKQKIKDAEDEIKNHKFLLLKSLGKNSKQKEMIDNLKQQLQKQTSQEKVSEFKTNKDKFKVPQLRLNQRYYTESEQRSLSTFSNQHNIVKEPSYKNKNKNLNVTTDEILEINSTKQQIQVTKNPTLGNDQFYEQSYKSRAKSQQHTLKKLEQTTTTQKTQEFSSSLIKSIKLNPQSYKYNASISS